MLTIFAISSQLLPSSRNFCTSLLIHAVHIVGVGAHDPLSSLVFRRFSLCAALALFARSSANRSSASSESRSGNVIGQYQCRGSHVPRDASTSFVSSSHAAFPSTASSPAPSAGESNTAAHARPSPGGTTSITRRAFPRGHVPGSSRSTPSPDDARALDPDSGRTTGSASSRCN